MMIVVSGYQVRKIVEDLGRGKSDTNVSLDLGLTKTRVRLTKDSVELPNNQKLERNILEKMAVDESDCFYLENSQAYRIQCYSDFSKKFLKLYATGLETAPTVSVSGIRMHQTKNMDPVEDTLQKISSIKVSGVVLDTCMGLGYTAIYARRNGAERVITIEKEPVMVEIAKLNPWSRQLFEDENIEIEEGDTAILVKKFRENSFDSVIHDPPRLSLAGGLYSLDYYRDLNRVLKLGGRLFHYVGNPGGRYRNRKITAGVKRRLQDAGFKAVEECSKAQGIRAFK